MNNERNMFEVAVRNKFRFPFRGVISVEDLWDLSVEDLDSIFKSLNSKLKRVKEESLLDTKTRQDEELDMKIEIVKYIVNVKLEERQSRLQAKENKQQKQKILKMIAEKQDESLQNKSIDELKAMIDKLD